ncbi:MAG: alpha/beta fold hydrolase, partial [Chloroflexi bacterium]|nr:alpha/beta fold hydrolase [Chloroflexota bacterium]
MHFQALGQGAPIVLLHSNASSVWSWSRVIGPLAKSNAIYALDTMGQGDSGKPSREYRVKDYAASVVDFMTAAGLGRASLIGNSVGAIIAVQLAAEYPDRIRRLVLVGCPCRETEEEHRLAMAATRARLDKNCVPIPRTLEDLRQHYVNVSPELLARVNEDQAKAGVWAWKSSAASHDCDIVSALRRIKAKTL